MSHLQMSSGTDVVSVPVDAIETLRGHFKGRLLEAGVAGYDESRTVWNAMIDRKPAVVVRCESADDIARAVWFAADHGILVAIKGGHNVAGLATCDNGLLIDLSGIKRIDVDPAARTATVDLGVRLAELDAATQVHGLAPTA